MNKEIKPGDKVWWFDNWSNLQEGKVKDIITENVRGEDVTYATISQGGYGGVSTGAKLEDCYLTKEECLKAENKRFAAQVAEYKAQIKRPEDLIQFMYDNDLNSEYQDFEARRAVAERAKELMQIDLEATAGQNWDVVKVTDKRSLMQFMFDNTFTGEYADLPRMHEAELYAEYFFDYYIKDTDAPDENDLDDDFSEAVALLESPNESMEQ